ncbi:hypothetical protein VA7868_02321 [Vibrio aerogenes CECT 7868]|uniref:GlyGly-CTERM sorting domain-containing protein n=1 Tax=Vibrio aerogenes CECT 7868 TaxID=1216006 RepID=A0A1M5Z5N2_9VIBR|nr:DUF3466 family protein [Vibrio aerogenes]SHI19585.1 hypothetical protein VA7868_02321 [Vibrio aerogenes CECT 7868]
MIQTNLRIKTLAFSIFIATNAHANLYQVVEVTPSWITDSYQSTFGVAVQPSQDDSDVSTNHNSCFLTSSVGGTACDDFAVAGETRYQKTMAGQPVDGIPFREEAPFGMDNSFVYAQSHSDLKSYCVSELLYATCSSWAEVHWDEWYKELSGDTTPNSVAFISDDSSFYDNSQNIVINSLTSDLSPVGIESSLGDSRATTSALAPVLPAEDGSFDRSRAWKTDGTYTVGSVSENYTNDNGQYYSSKAALWGSDGAVVQLSWPSGKQDEDERLAQGSMRDFVVQDGTIYGVGYNTYDSDNNYMNATVFKVSESNYADASQWTSTIVQNTQAKMSGDYVYSNSVLTGINKNLVAIGEAKRAGSRPSGGAAANRLFIVPDVTSTSLSGSFFSDDIEFSGAGGHASAINNYNEIVGQIDNESAREKDGKPRRKRAFIYPYNGNGSDTERMAVFDNHAWLLDDLTNDGSVTSNNNQYRILIASDINDAGVIAATAIKCEGGYSSTTHDASCGGTETTVAVKLVPVEGATSSDIQQRGYENNSTDRSGASFGSIGLSFLGYILFRRRKNFVKNRNESQI